MLLKPLMQRTYKILEGIGKWLIRFGVPTGFEPVALQNGPLIPKHLGPTNL
jgi:hypothetical protein